jgi:acyl dehydratase
LNEPVLAGLAGHDLGTFTATYTEADAILYALAVGARATELDLVYERDLRVLPTYGIALGLWAVETAGRLGAYDPVRTLHATQRLIVHRPLPAAGTLQMAGRVAAVWDKGKAAMIDIDVACAEFTATYSIFLPGCGGWGGDRGSSASPPPAISRDWTAEYTTSPEAAALYRLTGDRHPIHICPDTAAGGGFPRPILHGLCTLGITARMLASAAGAHPCELTQLTARLSAPVLPGDTLRISAGADNGTVAFIATSRDITVLDQGTAIFGS